jgi:hypothetical protein
MALQLPSELFYAIVSDLTRELDMGTLQAGALAFSQLLHLAKRRYSPGSVSGQRTGIKATKLTIWLGLKFFTETPVF